MWPPGLQLTSQRRRSRRVPAAPSPRGRGSGAVRSLSIHWIGSPKGRPADLADTEGRVDRAPGGAGVKGSFIDRRGVKRRGAAAATPLRGQTPTTGRYEAQPGRAEAGVEVAERHVHVLHALVEHLVLPDRDERHLDRVEPELCLRVLVHRQPLLVVELDAPVADVLPGLQVLVRRRLDLERRRGRVELLHEAVDVAAHAAAVEEPVVVAPPSRARRTCRSRCP